MLWGLMKKTDSDSSDGAGLSSVSFWRTPRRLDRHQVWPSKRSVNNCPCPLARSVSWPMKNLQYRQVHFQHYPQHPSGITQFPPFHCHPYRQVWAQAWLPSGAGLSGEVRYHLHRAQRAPPYCFRLNRYWTQSLECCPGKGHRSQLHLSTQWYR